MSLRQFARQFKSPGSLAQFWQGSSMLASAQVQEQQQQAGQRHWLDGHLDTDHIVPQSYNYDRLAQHPDGTWAGRPPGWDPRPLFEDGWESPEVSLVSRSCCRAPILHWLGNPLDEADKETLAGTALRGVFSREHGRRLESESEASTPRGGGCRQLRGPLEPGVPVLDPSPGARD